MSGTQGLSLEQAPRAKRETSQDKTGGQVLVLTRRVLLVYIGNRTIVTKYMQEARWTMVAREDGGRQWKTGIKVCSRSNRMEDSQGIYMVAEAIRYYVTEGS
jgi:hypothetical protein